MRERGEKKARTKFNKHFFRHLTNNRAAAAYQQRVQIQFDYSLFFSLSYSVTNDGLESQKIKVNYIIKSVQIRERARV
jgi:hypothetical protein